LPRRVINGGSGFLHEPLVIAHDLDRERLAARGIVDLAQHRVTQRIARGEYLIDDPKRLCPSEDAGSRLTVSLTDLNLCPCHFKTSMLLELNRPIELGRVDAASLI